MSQHLSRLGSRGRPQPCKAFTQPFTHRASFLCGRAAAVVHRRGHRLTAAGTQPPGALGQSPEDPAEPRQEPNLILRGSQSQLSVSAEISGSDSDAEVPGSSTTQSSFGFPPVPWGRGKIIKVMVLWLLAYIIIGQVAVPMGLSALGIDRDELTVRGHAVLHLFLDLTQLGVTLLILWQCLKKYTPRSRGLFPIKWGGNWPVVVMAACLVFPAVDWLAQQSLVWFPVDADNWAVYMEASLNMGDWITNVAYFSVVSICAPIWEEAIFRGFLLASLARYMAPHWAVVATSLLFAMCHFRLQTFFPLLVLGMVFSSVFLVTRNLLPPIVLHSAWNVFVLSRLT